MFKIHGDRLVEMLERANCCEQYVQQKNIFGTHRVIEETFKSLLDSDIMNTGSKEYIQRLLIDFVNIFISIVSL